MPDGVQVYRAPYICTGWLPVNRESLAPEATVCGGLEYRPGVSDTAGRTLRRLQLPKGVFYTTYCVAEKS